MFRKGDSRIYSQKRKWVIPLFILSSKLYCREFECLKVVTILSHLNPIHILITSSVNMYFNSILLSTPWPSWPSLPFHTKIFNHILVQWHSCPIYWTPTESDLYFLSCLVTVPNASMLQRLITLPSPNILPILHFSGCCKKCIPVRVHVLQIFLAPYMLRRGVVSLLSNLKLEDVALLIQDAVRRTALHCTAT
jgi:hypothetical protein